MSRIEGAEELRRDLQKLGDNAQEIERQMLAAGGKIMADAWKRAIEDHGFVDTGAMLDQVKPTLRKRFGYQLAEITSKGTDKHGVRNAAKAYILHYGTSRIRASHWIDGAEEQGTPPAIQAMEDELSKAINSTI